MSPLGGTPFEGATAKTNALSNVRKCMKLSRSEPHTRTPPVEEPCYEVVFRIAVAADGGAVTQESVGGARESGRVRSAAVEDRSTADGVERMPCPWRVRQTTGALRANGAARKRWNAQSAGCMRTQTSVECDSMCTGPLRCSRRASAQAAAAGTLNCNSVRRSSVVRTTSERFRIGGIIQFETRP